MGHTYDSMKLAEILKNIKETYYPEIRKLYIDFQHKIIGENL